MKIDLVRISSNLLREIKYPMLQKHHRYLLTHKQWNPI